MIRRLYDWCVPDKALRQDGRGNWNGPDTLLRLMADGAHGVVRVKLR